MTDSVKRRSLLKWGAALGGVSAVASPFVLNSADSPVQISESADGLFGHGKESIPMNAANLTPVLHPIAEKVTEYARQLNQDVSFINRRNIVDAFIAKLTPKTRVVTFTELSNISGTRMPVRDLCTAIHNYNSDIFVHVDGAQSWGCLDVNLDDMGCDSFSSSAHKWFMGPRGTGILYVNKKWATRIWPNTLGYDFFMTYPEDELPETARRFECIGQRDVAPYAAIGDAVDLYNQLGGSQRIEERIQALTQHGLNALDAAGIKTVTPRDSYEGKSLGHGVMVADLGSSLSVYGAFLALHNQGIASAFVSGSRVCCEPQSEKLSDELPTYLRLSPHVYNSPEDIDRAVDIIKRIQHSKFEIVKEVVRFL